MPPSHRKPKRGDILAVIAVLSFLGFLLLVAVVSSGSQNKGEQFNFGFGKEFDCQNVGYGDPVCTKRR